MEDIARCVHSYRLAIKIVYSFQVLREWTSKERRSENEARIFGQSEGSSTTSECLGKMVEIRQRKDGRAFTFPRE